jgi:hypothetical protein
MARAVQDHGKSMARHGKSITRTWQKQLLTEHGINMARSWQDMARASQEHGNSMATTTCSYHAPAAGPGHALAMPWQEHGKSMSRAWQPRGMARAWLGHGKSKARPLPLQGKIMARTWQGLPPYPLPSHYPSPPALPPPPLPPSATSHPVGPPGQVVAHKSSTCLCDVIFSTDPHSYVVATIPLRAMQSPARQQGKDAPNNNYFETDPAISSSSAATSAPPTS